MIVDKTQITPYKNLSFRQVEERDIKDISTATNRDFIFLFTGVV